MAIFEYRAIDTSGKRVTGTLVGPNLSEAAQNLQSRGLTVEHVAVAATQDPVPIGHRAGTVGAGGGAAVMAPVGTTTRPPATGSNPTPPAATAPVRTASAAMQTRLGYSGVTLAELMFFFRQFASMAHAGVPYAQSLGTLANQTRNGKLRRIVLEAADRAQKGEPISETFRLYPEVFNPLIVSLLHAGEQGGFVDQSAREIADYCQREDELRRNFRRMMIYPKLLVGASMFIILGANAIIASVGGTNGLSSPLTTASNWVFLGPILVVSLWFAWFGVRMPSIQPLWDRFKISVPVLGPILHKMAMAYFGRAFGALFRGGVLIPPAVRMGADACGNLYVADRIRPAADELEHGSGVTEAFAKTGVFSQVVLDMTHTGETSGQLSQMLDEVSKYYEAEAQAQQYRLVTVTGTLVGLGVMIYIGYVIISFWGGYFQGVMNAADNL
ncbi:MAG: type II secretion system F family protein [Fimbriimonadaceae bacterium]|nr:type II secretion system F family protein [Fimbriimonadaceae bacterium]